MSAITCCSAGTPLLFSSTQVQITVTDANDNAPVFLNTPYSARLAEGVVESTTALLVINATDADSGSNGEIEYSIAGGSGMFQIDALTVRICCSMKHDVMCCNM